MNASSEKLPSRILVVDDELVVWEVIRNVLDRPGFFLVYADDGEKAIALLLKEPFDLLIADKNLPGVTGLDVIRSAKAKDETMGTLLITAYASRESAEEAMAIGVDDYIVKPFETSDLEDKVSEVLENRRKRIGQVSSPPKSKTGRLRVIICEPIEATRNKLISGIRLLGHLAFEVDKVSDVLEMIRNKQAEALVCDLGILERDNAEACFLRGTLLVNPGVRFVVVAGERGLGGAVEAIHHGAGKVIYRPLLKRDVDVFEALSAFLGRVNRAT
ncbi:MAG: response regulator [Deltaproteobacteria bacterium]|nr:response regulator [Deltaproteobacteria bacterium]